MNFDEIISLLKSNDKDTYSVIYKSFPEIIRMNFDGDEEGENYERLINFFKNLVILKKLNLLKIGLETAYAIEKYLNILYDLAPTFFKNEMLREYYEIVKKYNRDKYFITEGLIELVTNMFLDTKPDKIYYLITETAVFAIETKNYELMKFLIDTWINRNKLSFVKFISKGMSDDDIKKTSSTINQLKDILNERFDKS